MEEFNKWWDEGCWSYQPSYDDCEGAWRAALEMVQDWYQGARGGFDLGLWDRLKKELEGTEK